MRRKFVFAFAITCLLINSTQAQVFSEGKNFFSAGYGIGTIIGALTSAIDNKAGFSKSTTGPLYFKYEHAMGNTFGLGLNFAYEQYKFNWSSSDVTLNKLNYNYAASYSSLSLLLRTNWHIGHSEKVDPYIGIGAGYRSGTVRYSTDNPNGSTDEKLSLPIPFGFEITVGTRYMFTENIGAYVEGGFAKSVFQLGITAGF